jgi:hypothetical protein
MLPGEALLRSVPFKKGKETAALLNLTAGEILSFHKRYVAIHFGSLLYVPQPSSEYFCRKGPTFPWRQEMPYFCIELTPALT